MSPAAKRIVARSFESRTDTTDTWRALQHNCLLLRRDQETAEPPKVKKGGLRDRLRQTEDTVQTPVSDTPATPASPGRTPPPRPAFRAAEPPIASSRHTPPLKPSPIVERDEKATDVKRRTAPKISYPKPTPPLSMPSARPGPRALISLVNGHRISLPQDGELVLGRFDPLMKSAPDVDLSFESSRVQGIAYRHARVVGWRGEYMIEDLGSSHGTRVNDEMLEFKKRHTLQVGDVVRLGDCAFFFDLVPPLWKLPLSHSQCFLYVTYTGHYLALPDQDTISIGRADARLNVQPDIDLGAEKGAAGTVSRRHARLVWHGEYVAIEDLGSTNKTQVNGQPVPVGTLMPIYPGQHLWLGGYTLAFDVTQKFT